MLCEILVGLSLSIGITAGAIADWNQTAVVSAWVFIAAGAALFMQYVISREELSLTKFYRVSSIAAREQQRTAGLVIVVLLAIIYIVGIYRFSLGFDSAPGDVNAVIAWYITQSTYFGTLLFFLPSILSRSHCGVLLVCIGGAVTQIAGFAVVVSAVANDNPLIGTEFLVSQIFITLWAVLYDLLVYNGCCCGSLLANHRGPRYESASGYVVGNV